MYIHTKHGFIEADQWDGTPIAIPEHCNEMRLLGRDVIVLRSRERLTLREITRPLYRLVTVFETPPDWDYEFRCYVNRGEMKIVMDAVVEGLDYRNFKSWCNGNAPRQVDLAHGIWCIAHVSSRFNGNGQGSDA